MLTTAGDWDLARRPRRTLGPLDLRSQAILRAVIEEYVTTAPPVGSQALVERYGLGVSSATVRNILAELETAGLLTHPHTSAGRVPTDAGYRFYVESIADTVPLPAVEQLMIRHQFGQVEFASEHWFRLAATTLAGLTRSAGLATPAKPAVAHIRRVDLVVVNERMASLILVLREGAIKQAARDPRRGRRRRPGRPQPRRRAGSTSVLADRTADRGRGARSPPRRGRAPLERVAARVGERIVRISREYDTRRRRGGLQRRPAQRDGGARSSPRATSCASVFTALENRAYLGELVGERRRAPAGSRSSSAPRTRRSRCTTSSLVLAPYGRPGRAIGVVGVLGPTRMSYPQAIGTVRFVSGLMNELVDHLYA